VEAAVKLAAIVARPVRGAASVLRRMRFSGAWQSSVLPFFRLRGDYYSASVGDGTGSSTVMAPLLWIARTFPEAPPTLYRTSGVREEEVRPHPMLRLLQRPNPYYTGPILWMATMTDWSIDGNAYWLKVRDQIGQVRELWYAPHWTMTPVGDDETFVSHYRYAVAGVEPVPIRREDVVHFRFGIDSEDDRKGYSPLKSVLREVFTDDEAAVFTASLLRNMGVPGLLVSPEKDSPPPSDDDVTATKAYLKANFTGDRRGEALVMSGPTKIQQFGFSPEQLELRELRRIPEERVSAVLGVPAIVAGLGAGLERSTFTNMGEAREMAYESNIIPTQRIVAEDIRFQLLPEFEPLEEILDWWRFGFDLSKVRVLQEDEDKRWKRFDTGVRGGWVTVAAAKRATGQEVLAGDDIYLRQMNLTEVPASGGEPRPLAPPRQQRTPMAQQTDPALLAMLAELAAVTRDASGAQAPTDPALLAVLQALVEREPLAVNVAAQEPDPAFAAAVENLADAVRSAPQSDPEMVALVAQLVARTGLPVRKEITYSDDRQQATVIEQPVEA
jgi:HK97 family phage portal protein